MNNVVFAAVQEFVFGHRCLRALIRITARVHSSHDPRHSHARSHGDVWHDGVDDHCLDYFATNDCIPCRRVIEEQATLNKLTN